MPQALRMVNVHIVFSTKNRTPWIDTNIRSDLHAYLAEVARTLCGDCFRVGGVEDHVHIAIRLPRTITTAKFVEELKTGSSKWVESQGLRYTEFYWRQGYGCFSFGPADLTRLINYVEHQADHHHVLTFKEEYLSMLDEYGIECDDV